MTEKADFDIGKKMLAESIRAMMGLYVNFYIAISILGIDLPSIGDDFKMSVEKAKLAKISLDTLISSIEKAQSVDEIKSALSGDDWLGGLMGR